MTKRTAKQLFGGTLVFFLLTSVTQAFNFGDAFQKKLDDLRRSPAEAIKSLPKPAEIDTRQLERALGHFSEAEERAIGKEAAGNLLGAAPLVNDPQLQKYVNRIGRWLALQSDRPDLTWHFGVIDTPDINAFAAPGGYVFVTRGLYQTLRNESELAGVLAHEIAHVVKKHQLKILEQARLLDQGGKLLSDQLGAGDPIKKLIGAGAEIFARGLDKEAEYEADRLAMFLSARAGYDPFGLPTVLQDLGHLSSNADSVALLFKTHPHPDDRLEHLDETGKRLDGIQGRENGRRFYRLKR